MIKIFNLSNLFLFVCILTVNAAAQTTANPAAKKKDKVEVVQDVFVESVVKDCKELNLGKATNIPIPIYPPEAKPARVGGTIQITADVNETGDVGEIKKVTGHRLLQNAATKAARKAKFAATTCDGTPTKTSAVLTYNFIPFLSTVKYFTPTKVEDFVDVSSATPFFDSISDLTNNHRLTFGYAGKKFYSDAPLTHGEFAHFLRLTLDNLSERANSINKFPREIGLFNSFNSQKITAVSQITNLDKTEPYADSVKFLLLKYDIALTNEQKVFQGDSPLTNNELIDLWTKIFGADSAPVNFERIPIGDRLISRGEFTLFLQESLQVLTYKVLP